jgi:hypothetical protein
MRILGLRMHVFKNRAGSCGRAVLRLRLCNWVIGGTGSFLARWVGPGTLLRPARGVAGHVRHLCGTAILYRYTTHRPRHSHHRSVQKCLRSVVQAGACRQREVAVYNGFPTFEHHTHGSIASNTPSLPRCSLNPLRVDVNVNAEGGGEGEREGAGAGEHRLPRMSSVLLLLLLLHSYACSSFSAKPRALSPVYLRSAGCILLHECRGLLRAYDSWRSRSPVPVHDCRRRTCRCYRGCIASMPWAQRCSTSFPDSQSPHWCPSIHAAAVLGMLFTLSHTHTHTHTHTHIHTHIHTRIHTQTRIALMPWK